MGYIHAFRRVADWGGRSSRSEFWGFFLVHLVTMVTLAVLIQINVTFDIPYLIYALVALVTLLGVSVRRLHDAGKSGA